MMLHVPASRRRAAAAALAAAGAVVFGWLLLSVAGNWGLADLDWPVLDDFAAHRSGPATAAAQAVAMATRPLALVGAAAAIAAVWGVSTRRLRGPVLLVGAGVATQLLVAGAKHWVDRDRPPVWFEALGRGWDGLSFPSGHTAGAATLVSVLLYLAYARRASLRGLGVWSAAAAALVGIVGASGLYLGDQWLTDVTASVAVSAVVLAGVVWIDSLGDPHPAGRPAPDTPSSELARSEAPADT